METNEGGQARKHHYVPQCYLKGFARNRSKKSQLYVVDSTLKRAFTTTPLNVAAERDFNRIEVDGEDPNLIESSYAEFERKLAPALVRMDERGDFPDDADRAVILELVALLAVRNPGRREAMRQFKEETTRRLMELAVANRQRWELQRQKAAEAGVEGAADLTYEEVREFVERGDFTIAVPTTEHVEQELKSLTTVYNLLHRRNWVVVKAAHGSGGFVTSDHPVTLCWDDKDMEGGFYPPGFGVQGTTVFCPVSKGLAIRGRFDGRAGVVELPLDKVAGINSLAIFHAGRQIYAENDRFRFFDKHLALRYGQDLLSTLLRPWRG
jgi:hypothetical protein